MIKIACLTVVYNEHYEAYAMIARNKDQQEGFPCGKVENWESLQEGAIRELEEETGITLDHLRYPPIEIGRAMMDDCLVIIFGAVLAVHPNDVPMVELPEGEMFYATEAYIMEVHDGRFAEFNRNALQIFKDNYLP